MSAWSYLIPGYGVYKAGKDLLKPGELTPDEQARQQLLRDQAQKAGSFADSGEGGFSSLGGQSDAARQNLADQASGKLSYSREALRQGIGQLQAGQRSMAASAAPQNGPMAALAAAQNSARLGSGLAGQQALAGIAEQQAAAKAYADATLAQRQQDLNAALGSRQNALTGYGANQPFTPQPSMFQQLVGGAQGAASIYATSQGKK
jgi:hypothetical protein